MELEMEARAPSNAAFLQRPPGRLAAFSAWGAQLHRAGPRHVHGGVLRLLGKLSGLCPQEPLTVSRVAEKTDTIIDTPLPSHVYVCPTNAQMDLKLFG